MIGQTVDAGNHFKKRAAIPLAPCKRRINLKKRTLRWTWFQLPQPMCLSKLRTLNLSKIDKCAMVLIPPLTLGKWRNGGVLFTPLQNLQMRGAFIAAFTSEKRWMTIKKSLSRHCQLIPNFFIAHLPILVRWKNKGAVETVCSIGR
jgi:hypothetical protein